MVSELPSTCALSTWPPRTTKRRSEGIRRDQKGSEGITRNLAWPPRSTKRQLLTGHTSAPIVGSFIAPQRPRRERPSVASPLSPSSRVPAMVVDGDRWRTMAIDHSMASMALDGTRCRTWQQQTAAANGARLRSPAGGGRQPAAARTAANGTRLRRLSRARSACTSIASRGLGARGCSSEALAGSRSGGGRTSRGACGRRESAPEAPPSL